MEAGASLHVAVPKLLITAGSVEFAWVIDRIWDELYVNMRLLLIRASAFDLFHR